MLIKSTNTEYKGLVEEKISGKQEYEDVFKIEKVLKADIFNGFDELIEHLDLQEGKLYGTYVKKNGKVTDLTRDVLRIFIDWISRGSSKNNDYWVEIPSLSLKKTNRGYRKLLDALEKGTENGAIVECDHDYRFNKPDAKVKMRGKCMYYRLAPKYRKRLKKKVDLKKPMYDMFSAYQKQNLLDIQKNDIGRSMINATMHAVFPTVEHVLTLAQSLIGTDNNKGQMYGDGEWYKKEFNCDDKTLENDKLVVDINKITDKYENMMEEGLRVPTQSTSAYRVTDSVCIMPKFIRNEVLLEEEEMIEVDVTALHPNIMAYVLKREIPSERKIIEEYLEGDVHSKMAEYLGVDRKTVKTNFLSYFNDRNANLKKYEVNKFFEEKLPKSLRWIRNYKRANHKRMSKLLFKNETILMENIVREIHKNDLKCFSVYDAIYVPKSKGEQAYNIVNEVIKASGLNTDASMEFKGKRLK